jgi:hypothetical protein
MKIRSMLGAWCASLALTVSGLFAAPNILYISSANDANYQSFVQTRFPEAVWVQKAPGTGADQIGGDLDVTADFTGVNGGTGLTRRAYIESFDLVIIGVPNTSTQYQVGADWAAISKPILVHSSVVARGTGTRLGLFAGDNVTTPTLATPADSARLSTSALSDTLLANVTDLTDLYIATSTDTVTLAGSAGQGDEITRVTNGTTQSRGLVYWPAGSFNGVGFTLVGHRAFFPLKIGNLSLDLTDNGRALLGNVITQLLIPPAAPVFPAPTLSAVSGLNQVALSWSAVSGATGYNLKRATVSGGPYTTLAANTSALTYTDTAVTANTTYYYVVSALGSVESENSAEASATPVSVIQPAKNILYVANSNSPTYQTFATTGQFANHTWTHKPTGLTGNDTIGGDLDRVADFTGTINAAAGGTVRAYLESFDLVIVSVPTTSGNFIDGVLGADWASLNVPVIVHTVTVARSTGGRVGLFSGDNFIEVTFGATDTTRVSNSALADTLLAGVADVTNLYAATVIDSVNTLATYGRGELITRVNTATASHHGVTFWATGAKTANGFTLAANRAFIPVRAGIDDLNADGRRVLANTFNAMDGTYAIPALPAPTNLVATSGQGAIDLVWTPSSGALTYTISRSTTSGSGYEVLSAGTVVAPPYADATAVPGTTYFYTVTAVDGAESAVSNEASAALTPAGPTLAGWRQTNFGTQENTGTAADSADPDADGRPNLLEYATGTDPLSADAGSAVTLAQNAGALTLTFNRVADPVLTYTVRGSSDLGSAWTETPAFSSTGPDNVAGPVTATDTVPLSGQARRFLRLEISY